MKKPRTPLALSLDTSERSRNFRNDNDRIDDIRFQCDIVYIDLMLRNAMSIYGSLSSRLFHQCSDIFQSTSLVKLFVYTIRAARIRCCLVQRLSAPVVSLSLLFHLLKHTRCIYTEYTLWEIILAYPFPRTINFKWPVIVYTISFMTK